MSAKHLVHVKDGDLGTALPSHAWEWGQEALFWVPTQGLPSRSLEQGRWQDLHTQHPVSKNHDLALKITGFFLKTCCLFICLLAYEPLRGMISGFPPQPRAAFPLPIADGTCVQGAVQS